MPEEFAFAPPSSLVQSLSTPPPVPTDSDQRERSADTPKSERSRQDEGDVRISTWRDERDEEGGAFSVGADFVRNSAMTED